MAKAPTIEEIMVQARKCLGLPTKQTTTNKKFAKRKMRLNLQQEKLFVFFDEIIKEIGLKADKQEDIAPAFINLINLQTFQLELEQKLFSFNASKQQITWFLLGYFYIPGIARTIANWQLGAMQAYDMPNTFWYLPNVKNIQENTNKMRMELPVEQVIDWLLDLLGKPMDHIRDDFDSKKNFRVKRTDADSIERTLYNWKSGKTLPTVSKIKQVFPDGLELKFDGCHQTNKKSSTLEQCQDALNFLRKIKKLDDEGIRDEIIMLDLRLDRILSGKAQEINLKIFIESFNKRYRKPKMSAVRHHLIIARSIQDAYQKLLRWMFPDVSPTETDPNKNKLLQMIGIYKHIHFLTIEANKQCGLNEEKENQWFFDQLLPFEKADLFVSILPSQYKNNAVERVAASLNNYFRNIQENHFETLRPIIFSNDINLIQEKYQRFYERKRKEVLEYNLFHEKVLELQKNLESGKTPWKTLISCKDYLIIYSAKRRIELSTKKELPTKINQYCNNRLRELGEKHPIATLYAIWEELSFILDENNKNKKSEKQVENLLLEAENHPNAPQWKAITFQYKAKHYLSKNEFGTSNGLAEKYFREALKACDDYNYGSFELDISIDLFAVAIATDSFNINNHEKYYRSMCYGNAFSFDKIQSPKDNITPEVINPEMGEYFWLKLYKAYPQYESKKTPFITDDKLESLIKKIMTGEFQSIDEKTILSKIKGRRGLTVFTELLIHLVAINRKLDMLPKDLGDNEYKNPFKKIISKFISNYPSAVNQGDFKNQTPLMLVTKYNDTMVLDCLIKAGADINTQDYHGRTALHGACFNRSIESAKALLSYDDIDLSKTTFSPIYEVGILGQAGQTVLYTAIRFGLSSIVKLILEKNSNIISIHDETGRTPKDLAHFMLDKIKTNTENIEGAERRKLGSPKEYQEIYAILAT